MKNNFGIGERAVWNNFPDVIRNSDLNALSNEPEYIKAKSGDLNSALTLVTKLITDDFFTQISQVIMNKNPSIVPVKALEESGRNKIPLALAIYISDRLNLELEQTIVQIDKVSRTNKGADHRLAYNPRFEGVVVRNKDYIILDDTLTMGGTLASLRGYIENRRGNVICGAVITAHPGSLSLPIKQNMYKAIIDKHGEQINTYWKETFNYGIQLLTQAEAGHLRKAKTFDEIRDRISKARNAILDNTM